MCSTCSPQICNEELIYLKYYHAEINCRSLSKSTNPTTWIVLISDNLSMAVTFTIK